jgi:hypothetical protein
MDHVPDFHASTYRLESYCVKLRYTISRAPGLTHPEHLCRPAEAEMLSDEQGMRKELEQQRKASQLR